MRRLLLVSLLLTSAAASAQTPQPRDLVLNEIAYDPPPAQGSSNEWVEVFNRSSESFDLGDFSFADAASTVELPNDAGVLAPGDYAVLVNDADLFAQFYPGVPFVEVDGFPALNNTGDTLTLLFGGTVIDEVPYDDGWGGEDASLERIDPDGPSDSAANWATTTDPDGGTPGAPNSVFAPDTDPPTLDGATALSATEVEVRFSEPLDPGTAGDAGNYSLDGGIGAPASVTVAPDGDASRVLLLLGGPLVPNTTYTLTVSGVADLAGNVLESAQTSLFFGQGARPDAGDVVVNEILYNEPSGTSPGEYVELFNRTDDVFDLSEFTLSDAAGTVPVSDAPAFLGPGAYAVLVESGAAFAAVFPGVPFVEPPSWRAFNDGGDAVVLAHESGVTVDSLFYDDSWGGQDRSLERKDPDGPSGFAVNWATTTAPVGTPGALNTQFMEDRDGPSVVAVAVSEGGSTLLVRFDEPLDPGTVSAGAFAVTTEAGEPTASVLSATYEGDDPPTVRLALDAPLAAGTYRLVPSDVADLLGNVTAGEPFAFAFTPDVTAPSLALAFALDPLTVEVAFSEPVTDTAADPAAYRIDNGIGRPEAVTFPLAGDSTRASLTLASPLDERVLYTLTVTGIADPDGNVLEEATAPLFIGAGDVPAPGDLVLNEILFDPVGGSDGEYVELFNRTDRLFLLNELVLTDDAAEPGDPISPVPVVVPPNGYAVVVADRDSFAVRFPEAPPPVVAAEDFPGLNNGGDTLTLLYSGTVLDEVTYDP
ncbi:MAG: lamin tail domain-containing protein, partial [Rubricoccaceae bacterium]|nr:lamin tail domain-containing protein [Rubricoccaceae bacterium]